jgi:hypothetical protein
MGICRLVSVMVQHLVFVGGTGSEVMGRRRYEMEIGGMIDLF